MSKAAIFDLDGTLINTIKDLTTAFNIAIATVGEAPKTEEQYRQYIGSGSLNVLKLIFAESNKSYSIEELEKMLHIFMVEYEKLDDKETVPYEGITELIVKLKNDGFKLAILSNKPHDPAVRCVKNVLNYNDYELIHGKSDTIPLKPSPDGLNYFIKTMGVEKENCFYIGDSDVDILTGKSAGVTNIGVTWGFRGRKELEGVGADYIVDTTDELYRILTEDK